MIGEIGTASVVAEVDGGTEESGLEGSDLAFYEYAVTGIGSLYSVASRLAADPGQAAELLREAIEAASEQWSARPGGVPSRSDIPWGGAERGSPRPCCTACEMSAASSAWPPCAWARARGSPRSSSLARTDECLQMNWASLPSLHRAVSERLGPRVALRHKRHGRYQDLSWRDYRRQADWAAAGLIDLGVQPGDRVAMLSENRYEWLVADHAILSTAAVTVPMHAPLSAKQVAYQIGHSDAKGVLVSNQEQASKVFEAIEELPKLEFLVSFDLITPRGPISGLTWEGLKHRGRRRGC